MIDRLRNGLRRRTRDDSGAILVLAIIIVTVVAVVTGLVLTRGDGSLRATVKLRAVAGSTYAADGAAQIVLNGLRTGHWDGDAVKPADWVFTNEAGDGCFGKNVSGIVTEDDDLVLSNFYPATKSSGDGPSSAYVECVPEEATGAQGTSRHVTNANSPGDAIIMLGNNSGETGLYNFNKVLSVRGGIRVNSTIDANGPIQVNDANVTARGASCTNITVSADFTKSCSTGGGLGTLNYPADASTIPDLQTLPSCTGSHVAFEPGYYDDAAALESLTTTCNKTLWFKPGTYYFDFHNDNNGDPLFEDGIAPDTDNEWRIEGRRVIGGALAGGGTPSASTPIPGACENPIDNSSAKGVQFIFGGDSRIYFDTDSLTELCATYRSTVPPIVIYGMGTGNNNPGNPSKTLLTGSGGALTTSGAPTVTGTGTDPATFTPLNADSLQDDGNGVATWSRVGAVGTNGNETRTLTMGGFSPPAAIKKGVVLKAARLFVTHKSAGTTKATPASTIKITPSVAGGAVLPTVTLEKQGTLTAQSTINLKTDSATTFDALAKSIHDKGFTGASIDFTAWADRNQSVQLDSVRLELEYFVPQMRGPDAISTNCTTAIGDSGCYSINTHKKSEVYLQGTTYVPRGRIYLEVANTDFQVFRWGVIGRSLHANLNGAYKTTGALIELPDNSPGLGLNGTLVQFNVHVCPSSPTCDATGKLALKVRAQIWDRDAVASTTSDREVTVLSWSHQR